MSTCANSRYSSGIDDLEKLYTLRDLFGRYGPVARLFLDDFGTEKTKSELDVATRAYGAVVDGKLEALLRTGTSFQYDHFNQGDSHTILLLDLYFPGVSTYKNISMVFLRRIASPMIGVRLGLLATKETAFKGRDIYNCMLQNSYFASAAGWVFEGRGHGVFSSGGSFRCKVLTTKDQLRIHFTTAPTFSCQSDKYKIVS